MAISVGEVEAVLSLRDEFSSKIREVIDKVLPGLGGAMKTAGDASANMGASVEQAFRRLGDSAKSFATDPLNAVKEAAGGLGSELVAALGPVGPAIVGVGAAVTALGAAMVELGRHTNELGESLAAASQVSQISVPALSNLKFAIDAAGGSLESVTNLMFMFEKRTVDSTEKVSRGLAAVGLSLDVMAGMNRDQQLLAISNALRATGDETNRAAVAFDIFGRQGRMAIPLLMKDLEGLTAQSKALGNAWTEENAKAAEEFQVHMRAVQAETSRTWDELGRLIGAGGLSGKWDEAWSRMKAAPANLLLTLVDVARGFGLVGAAWDVLKGKLAEGPKGPAAPRLPAAEGIKPIGGTGDDLELFEKRAIKVLDEQATAIKKARLEWEQYATSLQTIIAQEDRYTLVLSGLSGAVMEAVKFDLQHGAAMTDLERVYGLTRLQVEAIKSALKEESEAHAVLTRVLRSEASVRVDDAAAVQAAVGRQYLYEIDALRQNITLSEQMQAAHVDYLAMIGMTDYQRKVKAITDWGDIEKGKLNYSVANWQQAWDDIDQAVKDRLDALDIGTFVGPTLAEAGKTGGRNFLEGFASTLMRAFEGGGGLSGALKSLGIQITQGLFGEGGALSGMARSLGGMVTDLTAGLGSKISGVLGGLASTILPGIGGLIGAGLKALFSIGGPSKEELEGRQVEKRFESQFKGFDDMMKRVGEAYRATGRSAAEAQADVARMFKAEKEGAEATAKAIAKIKQAFDEQAAGQQALNEALGRYKFSIEELGPALSRQKLDEQSQQLYKDWQVLTGAGIDISTVTQKMSGDINAYVQAALKTGVEVPAAMKPMIERMIQMGLLTDAAGNKITDLSGSGITFSETMTQGFQKIVDAVSKLTDTIRRSLGLAVDDVGKQIKNLPQTIPLNVQLDVVTIWDRIRQRAAGAAGGGLVTREGVQSFAGGGNVLAFVPRAPSMGTDTVPAMLTPGEMVLNATQQQALARAVRGERSEADVGTANAVLSARDAVVMRGAELTIEALRAELRLLRRDLTSRMPEAVGFAVRDYMVQTRGRR